MIQGKIEIFNEFLIFLIGRINYIRFLKHHAPLPEFIGLVDESNKNPLPTIHEKSPRSTSDRSTLPQVCNKLRRKVNIRLSFIHALFLMIF